MQGDITGDDCTEVRALAAPRRRSTGASGALLITGTVAAAVIAAAACGGSSDDSATERAALVEQGKQIFRFDTFGDERQWTDTLRMHEVISAAVDPVTALSVGLKVDAEALPAAVVDGIKNGTWTSRARRRPSRC